MALRSDDKFVVIKSAGGDKQEAIPLSELNTFVSAEEAPEIATLQAQVGSYDPAQTSSTITDDLEAIAPTAGAPVAPVASTNILTVSAEPAEGESVGIAGKTYKFRRDALGAGVAASGAWTDSTNTLTVTAKAIGFDGNNLSVNLIDPGAERASTTAALNVDGVTIDVTLSSSAVPAITATLADVKEAIEADTSCNALVSCSITGTDTTVIDDTDITLTGGIDAQAANDVYSGGSAEHAIDNLVTAITTGYSPGVVGTGTVAHTLVTAAKKDADEMTVKAITAGVAGDLLEASPPEGGGSLSWYHADHLHGGVDGTPGVAGAIRYDATHLYFSNGISTSAVSNWKTITIDGA